MRRFLPCVMLIAAAVFYVLLFSWLYRQNVPVKGLAPWHESIFFAVQTYTTTGYGTGLTSVPASSPGDRSFHVLGSFAMLIGPVLFGLLLTAFWEAFFARASRR